MGVEPWKATNQSAITRPRMLGSAPSCSVEFPVDMKAMLAPPTSASAHSSSGRVGAAPASSRKTPKAVADRTMVAMPVRPIPATRSPPTTAPTPIAAVMKPKPAAPTCSPSRAITGRLT